MKFTSLLLIFLLYGCAESNKPQADTVVGILPYEGMSEQYVAGITKEIKLYYRTKVQVLKTRPLPKEAFVNIKSPRYRADSLIALQKSSKPENVDYIVGLTTKDISVTKRGEDGKIKQPEWRYNDFGIMGLAYCPGNSAVVSTFRLKSSNKVKEFGRFKKVVLHELGHNFGLPHCTDKKCVMTDAVESIKTVDNANASLCETCRKKIEL